MLAVGCGSGDAGTGSDAAPEDDEPTLEEALAEAEAALADRAPGVTDDAIRVGVPYLDTAALRGVIPIDHGDYESAYRSVIDRLNEAGGVHGRRIEPVFAPINPIDIDQAHDECQRLTSAEDVFVAMGYVDAQTLPCYLEAHDTAVIGGAMTADQRARAEAPWFTAEAGSDARAEVIRGFAESGALDGPVAVVALSRDEAELRDNVLPLLYEFGIDPVASGIIADRSDESADAAHDASQGSVADMASRFDQTGAQKVLTVGSAAAAWAWGAAPTSFRPQLLLTDLMSADAYLSDPAADPSLLTGAVAGSLYEGADVTSEPAMRDCLDAQTAAGVMTTSPTASPTTASNGLVASATACRNVALLRAILEAAGPDLDYGSFQRAGEGLGEVAIPGYPDPFHYGEAAAADGDPAVYLFHWDPVVSTFAVEGRR